MPTRVTESVTCGDLESIYREHGKRIWRALLVFSGDREIASDATSEAFAQALRRGADLKSPLNWIWKTAFSVAAGQLKLRGREEELKAEKSYESPEYQADLMEALKRLPQKQRAALVLFYYVDFTIKDIARVLGSTTSAVRVHLSVGRKRLKNFLEVDHE